jgi:NADH:ubiquinone oxidoreductase subunit K
MQALLLLLAAALVSLGWWTTTLRSFELQTLVGTELVLAGALVAVLGLVQSGSDIGRR